MCRLNFAQRPIFLGLRFFNEPEISLGTLPEDLCSGGFLRHEKIQQPQLGLNPLTLDLKTSTLPQDRHSTAGENHYAG